uniref:HECT-type E3 ubiquitin transferase n=1 Tax=Rhabditophanes sp. KR3021 TaxID=114890 RepID=A0AC35TNQ9_9BILA
MDARSQFIQATVDARVKRLESIKQDEAIVKLQSACRSKLVVGARLKDIKTFYSDSAPSSQIKNVQMLNDITYVLVLSKKKGLVSGESYIVLILRKIIQSLESTNTKVSFGGLFLSKIHLKRANVTINDLFNKITILLSEMEPSAVLHSKTSGTLVHFLVSFSSTSTWSLIKNNASVQSALGSLFVPLIGLLTSPKTYQCLLTFLERGICERKVAISKECINAVFTLLFRSFKQEGLDKAEVIEKFLKLLSIPSLFKRFSHFSLKQISESGLFLKIINFLNQNPEYTNKTLKIEEYLPFMGNYLYLSNLHQNIMIENLPDWLSHINNLLRLCQTLSPLSKSAENKSSKTTTYWHPLFGNISYKLENTSSEAFIMMKSQISLLWSCQLIRPLFHNIIHATGSSKRKEDQCKNSANDGENGTFSFGEISNSLQSNFKLFNLSITLYYRFTKENIEPPTDIFYYDTSWRQR